MKSQYLTTESEPRFWKLFAYSIFPIIMAVAVGLWLAGRIRQDADNRTQALRTEEVIAQDRLLVDTLWGAIEMIRAYSLSLERVRETEFRVSGQPSGAAPEGVILHWAQFEVKEGKVSALRQTARNPSFQSGVAADVFKDAFENWYLSSVQSRLNLKELQDNGVTVLRIKQEHGKEWLALGFAGTEQFAPQQTAQAPQSSTVTPVILALVDPVEAFPMFRRWTSRSEGGNLRGYIIGSDGYVIAHSQHSYIASDFSSTQVFSAGVSPMMQGRVRAGAGIYRSIDKLPVTVAYARPGTLPLGVVVERVNPAAESQVEAIAAMTFLAPLIDGTSREPLAALAWVVLLTGFTAAGLIPLTRVRRPRHARAAEVVDANEPALGAEAGIPMEMEASYEEPIEDSEPVLVSEHSAVARELPLTDDMRSSVHIEDELFSELLSDRGAEPEAQKKRVERVAMARFETETLDVQDVSSLAHPLAETASKLAGAPALFFSYRETMGVCLLHSHAGLPARATTQNVSFALSEGMRARIARYHKEGKTASLSDDPNLALMLAKRFGGARCDAWPVIDKSGTLIGVLAVLGAGPIASPDRDQSIERILRASASLPELQRNENPEQR